MRFSFPDHTPATDSRGNQGMWLGINKGANWTHSGQPLTFTNWFRSSFANDDQYSTIAPGHWQWYSKRQPSEQFGFICEK